MAERRYSLPPAAAFAGTGLAFAGVTLAAGAPTPLLVLFEHQWGFHAGILTVAFAIYAFGLLLALLVVGSLSDYIGRRPVLIGALSVQLLAMVMFFFASNIDWVIAARAVQGVATGAAFSAFTAALVELAPEGRRELGAVIGSVAPAGGLALGALLTGAAVQFTGSPAKIVFATLTAVTSVGIVVAILSAETVSRRPGAMRALRPEVSVPRPAVREFVAAVPLQIAAWMFVGLFLGLIPTILRGLFHINSGLVNGAAVFAEPGAAAVAGLFVGRISPRASARSGGAEIIVGAAVVLVAITARVLPLLVLGGLIGGVGWGSAYSGTLRMLSPLAKPDQRAGLFAALFTVAYLAFGLPVIVAGQLIPRAGLASTVIGYCAAIVGVGTAGLIAQLAMARRETSANVADSHRGNDETFVPGWPGCLPPKTSSETGFAVDRDSGLTGSAPIRRRYGATRVRTDIKHGTVGRCDRICTRGRSNDIDHFAREARFTMSDPTIVLVHGAFTDASSWRRLYRELAGDGLMIKAPPNPLRGIGGGDAEYTKSVIAQIDGPVLLVGHSYGGALITAAGAADNVVGLVYVAGFAPDEGETLAALQANFPATPAAAHFSPSSLPDGGTDFLLEPTGFREAFAADLPESEAAFMAISQRPLSAVALGEPAPTPAWRSKPSWGVLPTADGAIHPDLHRFSYDRMGAMVTEVEGASHAVMLSRPDVVGEVVRDAVHALVPAV
jgi:pimeloyl-ACP methyl ester carboxylesterase/MFS family permease